MSNNDTKLPWWAEQGMSPTPQFRAFTKEESEEFRKGLEEAGITLENSLAVPEKLFGVKCERK